MSGLVWSFKPSGTQAGEHKRQSANSAIEFVVCCLECPVLDQESEGKDL